MGLVLTLLAAAAMLAAIDPPAGDDTAAQPAALDVMSFNIRYGTADDGPDRWSERRRLVAGVIARHDPDVIGLQEALRFQLDELLEALPEYRSIGVGRDDGAAEGEHAAILYRASRLEVVESSTFWFSATPDEPGSATFGNAIPRICTHATFVDRSTSSAFRFYNVHLDHASATSRELSTAMLLERIGAGAGDVPVIVAGDFNAGEDSDAMATLLGARGPEAAAMRDAFRAAHPDASPAGTFGGFRGSDDGPKIDYVLVDAAWIVECAAIVRDHEGDRYPSDHYPVTARLRRRPDGREH